MDKLSTEIEVRAIPPDADGEILKENAWVVTPHGRIDAETAPAFEEKLKRAVEGSSYVVVNLQDVEYMSSAGLRAIVKGLQAAEEKRATVRLAAVPEPILAVMDIAGLNQKVTIFPTLEKAMGSFW